MKVLILSKLFSLLNCFSIFFAFCSQVDQDEGQEAEIPKQKPKKAKVNERPFSVETKYKGYEDLLDVDEDDPDIVVPHDVQGSVRALKYALMHPLIFSEPHGTYKERRIKKAKVSYHSVAQDMHLCLIHKSLGNTLSSLRCTRFLFESKLYSRFKGEYKLTSGPVSQQT